MIVLFRDSYKNTFPLNGLKKVHSYLNFCNYIIHKVFKAAQGGTCVLADDIDKYYLSKVTMFWFLNKGNDLHKSVYLIG